jgi:hypothetical protein
MKIEGLEDVVIGAEFKPNNPTDFVAPMASCDNDRDVGVRPNLPQEVETVILPKPQVENYQARIAFPELMDHFLSPRR